MATSQKHRILNIGSESAEYAVGVILHNYHVHISGMMKAYISFLVEVLSVGQGLAIVHEMASLVSVVCSSCESRFFGSESVTAHVDHQ
jgi:hypothetical protein